MIRTRLPPFEQVLSDDVTLFADSGGKVSGAARLPLTGAVAVSKFLRGLLVKFPLSPEQTIEVRDVNGAPALVGHLDGSVNLVLTIDTDGEKITVIRNIINPDKLRLIRIE